MLVESTSGFLEKENLPRRLLPVMLAIAAAGCFLLVANLKTPVVRNSFVYAAAAEAIAEHGFNPLPVIADPGLSFGKPILFSWLSAPLVSVLGANAGIKVASFIGTILFFCAAYPFFLRLNRHLGIEPRLLPLEFALLCANPLVLYQFWSGHADTLFAALVLSAFVLTDIIVQDRQRDSRALIPLLGAVIYAAILTKLYGFILLIACPAYLVLRLRPFFRESAHLRSKLTLSVVTFTVLGAAVVLARLGRNPTLDFAVGESRSFGAGYSAYVSGLTEPSMALLRDGLGAFLFTLILCFHIALFFLLKRRALAWPLAAGLCLISRQSHQTLHRILSQLYFSCHHA